MKKFMLAVLLFSTCAVAENVTPEQGYKYGLPHGGVVDSYQLPQLTRAQSEECQYKMEHATNYQINDLKRMIINLNVGENHRVRYNAWPLICAITKNATYVGVVDNELDYEVYMIGTFGKVGYYFQNMPNAEHEFEVTNVVKYGVTDDDAGVDITSYQEQIYFQRFLAVAYEQYGGKVTWRH